MAESLWACDRREAVFPEGEDVLELGAVLDAGVIWRCERAGAASGGDVVAFVDGMQGGVGPVFVAFLSVSEGGADGVE